MARVSGRTARATASASISAVRRVDVDQHRRGAGETDAERRRNESEGRHDHLVARTDVQGATGEVQSICAAAHADAELGAAILRELGLKQLQLFAQYEIAARQYSLDGGVDLGLFTVAYCARRSTNGTIDSAAFMTRGSTVFPRSGQASGPYPRNSVNVLRLCRSESATLAPIYLIMNTFNQGQHSAAGSLRRGVNGADEWPP